MATLFPIILEVEETAVGAVLRLLKDYPGVAKLHLDLDNVGKKPVRRNGGGRLPRTPKSPDAPRVNDVIIGELLSGQKNLAHLKEKVVATGGSVRSVDAALHVLRTKGIAESAGIGIHRLTERAMQELGSKAKPETSLHLPAPTTVAAQRGVSLGFVRECIGNGMDRAAMRATGEPLGINARMIDGAITRLKARKEIAKDGDTPGLYRLTTKSGGKPK